MKGVVLTMYDARTNLSAEVAAEVRRHLGDAVYDTVVPRSVRLPRPPATAGPIAQYAPDSRGAAAYRALATDACAADGRATAPSRRRCRVAGRMTGRRIRRRSAAALPP